MVAKWTLYREKGLYQEGKRPPEGYPISKTEKELLTYLLCIKQHLILHEQNGVVSTTGLGLACFLTLIL